jgi:hypothetical protein
MTLFSELLLGHLLGDWLLQSDWMALGKRRGLFTWPGVTHFTLYTVSILGTLWFFGSGPGSLLMWGVVGLIIFLTHWLVDSTNLVQGWMRLAGQRDQALVRLMVDQTLHLFVLALIVEVVLR